MSNKVPVGVALILANFGVGKIAVPLFAVNAGLAITIYLISWHHVDSRPLSLRPGGIKLRASVLSPS